MPGLAIRKRSAGVALNHVRNRPGDLTVGRDRTAVIEEALD
jgi:hypothetical protein